MSQEKKAIIIPLRIFQFFELFQTVRDSGHTHTRNNTVKSHGSPTADDHAEINASH